MDDFRAGPDAAPVEFVICGGSALILTGMIPRTTKGVDVVAMIRGGVLYSPDPLPEELQKASAEVAEDLGLSKNWLNNGPSKGDGGLTSAEREELSRLRRENRKLKEEREILSKAAAWFATESGTSKRSSGS